MVAKFGEARRRAFLDAVRGTGNQTIAAERAKVSRSWVTLHRANDPAFSQQIDEAVAEARATLRRAQGGRASNEPPTCWGFLDGEELVVRGTGGAGGGKRVQIARARLKQWSPRVEERFLETLAATCNVKAACAAVGMTAASAYGHRKRWLRFAERWDEAIEIGFSRIEAGLVEHACNMFSGEGPPVLAPTPAMTVMEALQLLHMHKHQVRGIGKAPGKRWQPPKTLDDVGDSILRRLDMFLAAKDVSDEQRARDEEEWARRRAGPDAAVGIG